MISAMIHRTTADDYPSEEAKKALLLLAKRPDVVAGTAQSSCAETALRAHTGRPASQSAAPHGCSSGAAQCRCRPPGSPDAGLIVPAISTRSDVQPPWASRSCRRSHGQR